MKPKDDEMEERAAERDEACTEIQRVLDRLAGESRRPDLWERVCLARALGEVFSGCYGLAIVDARLALTPLSQRSPEAELPTDPFYDRCDIELLTRALRRARAQPVQEFPIFTVHGA